MNRPFAKPKRGLLACLLEWIALLAAAVAAYEVAVALPSGDDAASWCEEPGDWCECTCDDELGSLDIPPIDELISAPSAAAVPSPVSGSLPPRLLGLGLALLGAASSLYGRIRNPSGYCLPATPV